MHYLDEGPRDAPAVLMLHGNPTWSFYYRGLVRALRDRFRCIVPDHLGCGLSDKPDDARYGYRLQDRIADLQRLLDHLAPAAPVHLVVHDWGGMIGFGWAARCPERIASTVIMNTAAFRMPAAKRLPATLWLAGRTPLGAPLVRGCNAFARFAARLACKKPLSQAVRRAYIGPYDSWRNRIATLRFVQDIPLGPENPGFRILEDTEARLEAFRDRPALIAWGERDFVFDRHFLARWRELLPHAELHAYPDCGHYVLEDAGPMLTAAIAAFLDRTRAAGTALDER